MARKRMLSPEFFTSETMAALPIPTRLTYAGLWVYFDDDGRGKDNALAIKGAVWPLDEKYTARKVAADVDLLVDAGPVCRYECHGSTMLHAPDWFEWQQISHPTPSRLCPCPDHDAGVEHPKSPERLRRKSGTSPRSVVKGSSEEVSAAAAAETLPPPRESYDDELPIIAILRQRLAAAGLTASWSKVTDEQRQEIAELVVKHGGDGPLIDAARRQHRANDPAVYAGAWLSTWRQMPTATERLRVVESAYCPDHPNVRIPCFDCATAAVVAGER